MVRKALKFYPAPHGRCFLQLLLPRKSGFQSESAFVQNAQPSPICVFRTPACTPPNRDATLRVSVSGLIADCKESLEILRVLREWRPRGAPPFHCRWVGARHGKLLMCALFNRRWLRSEPRVGRITCLFMSTQALREEMNAQDILIHVPTKEAFSWWCFFVALGGLF